MPSLAGFIYYVNLLFYFVYVLYIHVRMELYRNAHTFMLVIGRFLTAFHQSQYLPPRVIVNTFKSTK